LLTGDAAPFCVQHLTDQDGVTLLRKQNGDEQYHLLTTLEFTQILALMLTRPERRSIARNTVTRYTVTILIAEVGSVMMQELAVDRLYLTVLGEPELERLKAGKLGPYELRKPSCLTAAGRKQQIYTGLPNSSVTRVPPRSLTRNPPCCVPTAGSRSINEPPIVPCWI